MDCFPASLRNDGYRTVYGKNMSREKFAWILRSLQLFKHLNNKHFITLKSNTNIGGIRQKKEGEVRRTPDA